MRRKLFFFPFVKMSYFSYAKFGNQHRILQVPCIPFQPFLVNPQAPCEAIRFLRDVCKSLARPPTILGTSSDIDFKEPDGKDSQNNRFL